MLLLFIIVLVNTYPVLTTQSLIVDSKRSSLLKTANMVSNSLAGLQSLSTDKIESVLSILDLNESARAIITDHSGKILYDSYHMGRLEDKYLLLSEVFTALSGLDSFRCRYQDEAFESTAAVPVIWRNEILGTVLLYEYDVGQAQLLVSMQSYLRNLTVVVSFVTLLLGIAFSQLLKHRINGLVAAIQRVREGQYSHRAAIGGHDELSILADEFNELSGRLQKTEELRRQFVSNASHELKTPLSSIKLLADSIVQTKDMRMEDVREFLGDISEEITRLTRITDRLLTLTRLDVDISQLFMPVDLSAVVGRASHMLEPLAAHYKVTIQCSLTDDCIVLAEEDSLYQIVFNLMENAIKYNVEGGDVHVYTFIRDELVHCIVDDTGIGMPAGELNRVFERFYRVDKARSRETGGTGLGLSIVQKTVELYGGKVWAENRELKGARFTVTLPYKGPQGGAAPELPGKETPRAL